MRTGKYGFGVAIEADGAHWYVWKGNPQNIVEQAKVPLKYAEAEAQGYNRMCQLEDALGLTAKDPKIQKLFSDFCDAECALDAALNKLPNCGKKCDCKEETATIKVFLPEDEPARCLDCGGKV